MIGMSEGNGHPFSFSAIINGYDKQELHHSGWPVIYNYVLRRDHSEFGMLGAQVTHAWTQNFAQTEQLCKACLIPNAVVKAEDMIGQVDAVIIARDDYEQHLSLAKPFLEAGVPVFVDKPLTLDLEELRWFKPYLESGQLMSCSGMKFAKELDEIRTTMDEFGTIKLIRGAVINSWEKYGVHLVDAILNFITPRPVAVFAIDALHSSVIIYLEDQSIIQIDALDNIPLEFNIQIWGERKKASFDIRDNFSMFRRTLWHFIDSVQNDGQSNASMQTIESMKILIAGNISRKENRKVWLHELNI